MWKLIIRLVLCILISIASTSLAQEEPQPEEPQEERRITTEVYVDAIGAAFGGNNSYFGASESYIGANTDSWAEGAAELGLRVDFPVGKSAIFGDISGMGTATWGDDASGLTVDLDRTYEFDIEQAHIGWRSGTLFSSLDEDALTITAGNLDYLVGTGLLIADGTSDGGPRGGWFLSLRKAFRRSFLATLKSGPWKVDGFYLQGENRTDPERVYSYGGNFELELEDPGISTGVLYFRRPEQTGFGGIPFERYDSLSLMGDWAATEGLSFAGEYVFQDRPGTSPKGWYAKGAYQWSGTSWKPEVSYRYAAFDGDDTTTPENEAFATAAYGFTDYGTWFQGEISGNYPLDNSNLKSHMVRMQLFPTDELVLNVIYYDFTLDQPNVFGDPVGSTDWGDEFNLAADYSIGDHWFLNGVFGLLFPGQAGKNLTGGDKTWVYAMFYASYSLSAERVR